MRSLNVQYNGQLCEIPFDGFKVFQTKNPNLFTRDFFNFIQKGMFANVAIRSEQTMLISDFSKTSDFFTFSKNSEFTKMIIEEIVNGKLIDPAVSAQIVQKINELFGFQILEENINFYKLLSHIFSISEDEYLAKESFLKIINSSLLTKKTTFIFNDISWLNYNDIAAFLNLHNFIFITNDFRKNIKSINLIESVVLLADTILEIASKEKFVSFIEKKMNSLLTPNNLENFFNCSNDKTSCEIYAHLLTF